MSRIAVKPYLIARSEDGAFRITIRRTRFNSQGYPLVSAELLDQAFPTAMRARSWLRAEYRAETTEIATK